MRRTRGTCTVGTGPMCRRRRTHVVFAGNGCRGTCSVFVTLAGASIGGPRVFLRTTRTGVRLGTPTARVGILLSDTIGRTGGSNAVTTPCCLTHNSFRTRRKRCHDTVTSCGVCSSVIHPIGPTFFCTECGTRAGLHV